MVADAFWLSYMGSVCAFSLIYFLLIHNLCVSIIMIVYDILLAILTKKTLKKMATPKPKTREGKYIYIFFVFH